MWIVWLLAVVQYLCLFLSNCWLKTEHSLSGIVSRQAWKQKWKYSKGESTCLKYIESPVWILSREDQLRGRGFEVDGTGLMGVQDAPDRSWTLHVELLDHTGCESRREPTSGVISRDSWSSTNFVVCFGWWKASTPKQLRCCYSTMKGQDARHPGSLCSEFILWWGPKQVNICVTESNQVTRLQVLLDIAGGTNANLWCEPGGPGADLWFRQVVAIQSLWLDPHYQKTPVGR